MVRIAGQGPGREAVGVTRVVITYERPSRLSRVAVVVSALSVLMLAGWVLTPIVVARHPAAVAAIPFLRDMIAGSDSHAAIASRPEGALREAAEVSAQKAVEQKAAAQEAVPREPVPQAPSARETAPQTVATRDLGSHDLVPAPPAAEPSPAQSGEPAAHIGSSPGAAEPVAQASERPRTIAVAEPAPADDANRPTLAAASATTVPLGVNEPVGAVALIDRAPWPIAAPEDPPTEPAIVSDEPAPDDEVTASTADGGPVPMPRRRPDAAALARLAVPLPRPRPYEATAAGTQAQPRTEQLLFDRMSAPN